MKKTLETRADDMKQEIALLSQALHSQATGKDEIEHDLTCKEHAALRMLERLQTLQGHIWERQAVLEEEDRALCAEKDAYILRYDALSRTPQTWPEREYRHELIQKAYAKLKSLGIKKLRLCDRALDAGYALEILLGDRPPRSFAQTYEHILTAYADQLYRHAQDVLKIDDCETLEAGYVVDHAKAITIADVRSCQGQDFFRIFEIAEVDGETYGDFWDQLWTATHTATGDLPHLRRDLANTFEERI